MDLILVTDDEPDIRLMLRTVLRARGWTVEEAASGQEALDRCALGGVDLVVLDQKMPGLTGSETAVRLQGDGFEQPIVLYSAYLTPELQEAAMISGIQAIAKDDLPGLLKLLDSLRP